MRPIDRENTHGRGGREEKNDRIAFFGGWRIYLLDERVALGDVLLQLGNSLCDELLLIVRELTETVDLLDTLGTQFNVAGEVLNTFVLEEVGLDKGRLNDTLLATNGSLQDRVGEAGASEGHGKSSGASSVLCLDNLVATELDAMGQGIELFLGEFEAGLGEQGDDGDARVATDDGNLDILGVLALDFRDEARGTDNVQGGDTVETLGVEDASLLQGLGEDGNSGVNGVGNDQEVGVGAVPEIW